MTRRSILAAGLILLAGCEQGDYSSVGPAVSETSASTPADAPPVDVSPPAAVQPAPPAAASDKGQIERPAAATASAGAAEPASPPKQLGPYPAPPSPPQAAAPAPSAAPPPAAASSAAAPPAASSAASVRLSTGVALPQSLPVGTKMGFSVDYRFMGSKDPSAKYVWVIRSPQGATWQSEVTLRGQDTLQTFVLDWGPVTGTYQTYIDEVLPGSRKTISNKLGMTYAR